MQFKCQSGPGSNGNEGVLHIPQSSSITFGRGAYHSAEKQSVLTGQQILIDNKIER